MVLAAAVATAVLTGALLVGDSVRGSLRDLALDRLGSIDDALVGQLFFREELTDELPAKAAAPIILLRGSAVEPDSGARASKVQILGVDDRFAAFYQDVELDLNRRSGQLFGSVVVNESLARELGLEVGETLVLSFGRPSQVPRDSLMGETDPVDLLATLRLIVSQVVADRGLGRFALEPHQQNPLNAFVELPSLQRALDRKDQVNGILRQRLSDSSEEEDALRKAVTLEDMGLLVEVREGHMAVESRDLVLRPDVAEAALKAADEVGAKSLGVQTYLANEIRSGERSIPYSMVTAVDPLEFPESLALLGEDGGARIPRPGGVILNRWAADDLEVKIGDRVELEYYVVGAREELEIEHMSLRFDGVVGYRGLAGDRSLTPDYPGLQEVEDMSAWDPPFPVDLARVRSEDEEYWDDFGATPKAFVSAEIGEQNWSTRYGSLTSVRIAPSPGQSLDELSQVYREALRKNLSATSFGFRFRAIREIGLEAAKGSSDFSSLFIGFSFFLIASAGLLISLLFRLGVEQRAGEVGLLYSLGFTAKAVRKIFLSEGAVLAAIGALLGTLLGVAYAALMMWALGTLWIAAVGSSQLELHIGATSLISGFLISVIVILASIAGTLRWLGRMPAAALLAGAVQLPHARKPRGLARYLAWGGLILGLSMLMVAFAGDAGSSPALAFGTGASLLASGLAFFAIWCRGSGLGKSSGTTTLSLARMAARNGAWNPGRSLLSVALIASASFVIITVASNQRKLGDELALKSSASGGFALVAESDVPLHQHLDREEDRFDLGFSAADFPLLDKASFFALRMLPGDDASCLNLYRPQQPRVLGVPSEMVQRGGFSFLSHAELPSGVQNPWQWLEQDLEEGVVPAIADANSAQWILHMGLGDEITIENDAGRGVRLRLVGLLARSVLQSELLIGEAAFLESFPERSGYSFFLVDVEMSDAREAEQIAVLLEDRLDRFGFDATTAVQKLLSFLRVEHTYLSTFQLLGGLGLLLGTLGLAIVLMRNVVERRGELATLRALGFPQLSLVHMILAENAFLLTTGLSIGSFSALIAVAPELAKIEADWFSLAAILLAVFAVGMLASTAAVLLALRAPLLPSLKNE